MRSSKMNGIQSIIVSNLPIVTSASVMEEISDIKHGSLT